MPINTDEDDCYLEQPIPIIQVASVQYGNSFTSNSVIQEHHIPIAYLDFMRFYSWSKEFNYIHPVLKIKNALLTEEQEIQISAIQEVSPVIVSALTSDELNEFIDGEFVAVVEVSMWSVMLDKGIKQKIMFHVRSAPRKSAFNNHHIYQILSKSNIDADLSRCR
jgi:hypothetical protein